MWVFLPVAGVSINLYLLVGIGAFIGFLSGLLGVGGGFLLTPILMMAGIPPTVAAASDTNAIIATSSSGVAAHFRLANVDFKMGTILLFGGLVGSAVGVQFIRVLKTLGDADLAITIFYILVLGIVGGTMFVDSFKKLRGGLMARKPHRPIGRRGFLARLPLQMSFPRSGVQHSIFVPFLVCVLTGVLTAIMGVGGGFMLVPMMVYLLGMPIHVAIGTSLFQILFTCAGATLMQSAANHTVDLVLALLLAAGSTIGAQIGARASRRLRGEQLMILLASLALFVVVKMTVGVMVRPPNRLTPATSHAMLMPKHDGALAAARSPAGTRVWRP